MAISAFAAERFRPQMMIWQLPLVCFANASAALRPIPEVPPTNIAMGVVDMDPRRAAFWDRAVAADIIVVVMGWWVMLKSTD